MTYDLLNMGRSSIDLYSNDIGTPFERIGSFAAYVGGSPLNICVGAHRLGLDTALLTAVGDDPVGDFILHFLKEEGITTEYIPRKPGHRTSAVVLGIEPPDKFPLVYYRDNCADIELNIDDVLASPITDCKVFQFAGTNLSKEPSRSATMFGAELAKQSGAKVVFDVDFRPNQWHDVRAFGVVARSVLRLVDVVIGTEDELNAAVLSSAEQMELTHSQISDTKVAGDTQRAIDMFLQSGPEAVIEKRGAHGARIHLRTGEVIDAPGYPVDVKNILGAGDAFGGGFLYGYVKGWDWRKSARLGNACGAIVVMAHGCANFMPTMAEIEAFIEPFGGLE
jgi:5-dehydro-2-deoxygluconokinase